MSYSVQCESGLRKKKSPQISIILTDHLCSLMISILMRMMSSCITPSASTGYNSSTEWLEILQIICNGITLTIGQIKWISKGATYHYLGTSFRRKVTIRPKLFQMRCSGGLWRPHTLPFICVLILPLIWHPSLYPCNNKNSKTSFHLHLCQ